MHVVPVTGVTVVAGAGLVPISDARPVCLFVILSLIVPILHWRLPLVARCSRS